MQFEVWIKNGREAHCVMGFNRPWSAHNTPPYTTPQRRALFDEARMVFRLYPEADEIVIYRRAPDLRHVITLNPKEDEDGNSYEGTQAASDPRLGHERGRARASHRG